MNVHNMYSYYDLKIYVKRYYKKVIPCKRLALFYSITIFERDYYISKALCNAFLKFSPFMNSKKNHHKCDRDFLSAING